MCTTLVHGVPHLIVLDHVEFITHEFPIEFIAAIKIVIGDPDVRLVLCTPRTDNAYVLVGNKSSQKTARVTTAYCSFSTEEDAVYTLYRGFSTRYLEDALVLMAGLSPNSYTLQMVQNRIRSLQHDVGDVYKTAYNVYERKNAGLNVVFSSGSTHSIPLGAYDTFVKQRLGRGLLLLGKRNQSLFDVAHTFVKETMCQHRISDSGNNWVRIVDFPIERGIQTLFTLVVSDCGISAKETRTSRKEDIEEQTFQPHSYFEQIQDNLSMSKREEKKKQQRSATQPMTPLTSNVIDGIEFNLARACKDIQQITYIYDRTLEEFGDERVNERYSEMYAPDLCEGQAYIIEHIASACGLNLKEKDGILPHFATHHLDEEKRLGHESFLIKPLPASLQDALCGGQGVFIRRESEGSWRGSPSSLGSRRSYRQGRWSR